MGSWSHSEGVFRMVRATARQWFPTCCEAESAKVSTADIQIDEPLRLPVGLPALPSFDETFSVSASAYDPEDGQEDLQLLMYRMGADSMNAMTPHSLDATTPRTLLE